MKTNWYACIGAIVGIVVTLATGLIDTTPARLVGAVWYGYPLAWLYRMIVAPQYYPWRVGYANLAYDLVVWIVIFVVIFTVLGFVMQGRKHRTTPGAAQTEPPSTRKA